MLKRVYLLGAVLVLFLSAVPFSHAATVAQQTDDSAQASSTDQFVQIYTYGLGTGLSGTVQDLKLRFDSAGNNWLTTLYCDTDNVYTASGPCGTYTMGDGSFVASTAGTQDYTANFSGAPILNPTKYYFFDIVFDPNPTPPFNFVNFPTLAGSANDASYAAGTCQTSFTTGATSTDGLCAKLPDIYFKLETIDPLAPALPTVSIASNNASTAVAKVGDTVTVAFTSNVELGAASSTIAGQPAAIATTSPTSYTASYQLTASDSEGSIPFILSYANLPGEMGFVTSTTTDASSVIFDKTAPALQITNGPANNSYTNSTSTTFTFAADAPTACSIDGAPLAACAGSYSASGLSSGTHLFTVSATDEAGNTSVETRTWNIDTAAPILHEVAIDLLTSDTTPEYKFSSSKPGTIFYGGACSSATTVAVLGDNTIAFNTLAVGTYSDCTLKVVDSAGNMSQPLQVSTFTVTPVIQPSDAPTDKDQCKVNGWRTFVNPSFKNQGDCVSFVEKRKHDKD